MILLFDFLQVKSRVCCAGDKVGEGLQQPVEMVVLHAVQLLFVAVQDGVAAVAVVEEFNVVHVVDLRLSGLNFLKPAFVRAFNSYLLKF